MRPRQGELTQEFGDQFRGSRVYMFGSDLYAHLSAVEGFFFDMGDYGDEVVLLGIDSSRVRGLHQVEGRENWEWCTDRRVPSKLLRVVRRYDTSQVLGVED